MVVALDKDEKNTFGEDVEQSGGEGNSTMINEETVQTINSLGDLSRTLYDLEDAAERMADVYFKHGPKFEGDDDKETMRQVRKIIGETEQQSHALRDYLAILKATSVIRHTDAQPGQREVEQLGFGGYVGKRDDDGRDYIEFSIPYNWLASTSSFMFNIKKYQQLKNLSSATHEWHWMMEGVLKKMEQFAPFSLPIQHAKIDIVFFKPNLPLGDPDHFWYRPVIDALVQRGFISSDDAGSLQIHVAYEHDPKHPELRIILSELTENERPKKNIDTLKRIF